MNKQGLQDEDEDGISDVELELIHDKGRARVEGFDPVVTAADGVATFVGVPKGLWLRARVTNKPPAAARARENVNRNGHEDLDSDLQGDSVTSQKFNLATFEGQTFSSIDLGYVMPADLEVRVWEDGKSRLCISLWISNIVWAQFLFVFLNFSQRKRSSG